jgi:hypothetical protein
LVASIQFAIAVSGEPSRRDLDRNVGDPQQNASLLARRGSLVSFFTVWLTERLDRIAANLVPMIATVRIFAVIEKPFGATPY